jgi:hypothetical protein
VTHRISGSSYVSNALTLCFVDGDGKCPAALPRRSGRAGALGQAAAARLAAGSALDVVEPRLLLSSDKARAPFTLRLEVTHRISGSSYVSNALTLCFVDGDGKCPAALPRSGGGLLWPLLAAPAALVRLGRRRRRAWRQGPPWTSSSPGCF